MPSKYPIFDRSRLTLLPLEQRVHDVPAEAVLPLAPAAEQAGGADLDAVADAIVASRRRGAAVAMMMGAHVIKTGCSRFVIDLIRRGWISVLACNGACLVHDYELAAIGATSESVARYISLGQFGLWQQTGRLNDVIRQGAIEELGLGEAAGRHISTGKLPHKDLSIFAAAWEASVPATVHVGVGYDIIHEHPNCDGAALGAASYRDFLIFARVIENLEGGVLLCFGTAVMGPEVYLKALAMARNVAHSDGRRIVDITSAVFDLVALGGDAGNEPSRDCAGYYYRPHKTILARTVRDGGRSYYIRGEHAATLPGLWSRLIGR